MSYKPFVSATRDTTKAVSRVETRDIDALDAPVAVVDDSEVGFL